MNYVSFSGLPRLLLSATHLVNLNLRAIPESGYISPEAIVACGEALTWLETFVIGFKSPRSRPDQKSHPPTRTLLPVLTKLEFKGVSEYLEYLVACIDASRLGNLFITFFHQLIFDIPQLTQFISRTPKFKTFGQARVVFSHRRALVILPWTFDGALELAISCRQPDWQLSSLARVCRFSFLQAVIPTVKQLHIHPRIVFPHLYWQDDFVSSQWLELFHPFTAVTDLYLSRESVPCVVPVLQKLVGERVTGVFPALQTFFLEKPLTSGPVQEAIERFVAERQFANHPITISRWERK